MMNRLDRSCLRIHLARCLAPLVLLLGCVWAAPGAAQVSRADSVQHRNDCRLARQVLEQGHPANKRAWALSYFVSCGSGAGEIVANVLVRHRGDASFSHELDEVVSVATGLVDGRMAVAAVEVAVDPSAGTAARVQALRLLYAQVRPGTDVSYARLITSGEHYSTDYAGNTVVRVNPVETGFVVDQPVTFGTDLPLGEISRIGEAVASLNATTETSDVRTAAGHVSRAYRSYLRCPRGTPHAECMERMRSRTP